MNIEKILERGPLRHTTSSLINSYNIVCGVLVTTDDPMLIHYSSLLTMPIVLQISLFYLMYFSVLGSHPGSHVTFSHQVSLVSSWLWEFLRQSLFLMTLTVLRTIGQVFQRMPLCRIAHD